MHFQGAQRKCQKCFFFNVSAITYFKEETYCQKTRENNPHYLSMEIQESLKNILKLFHISIACKSRYVITSYGELRGNHRKPLKLTKNNSFMHKDVRNVKLSPSRAWRKCCLTEKLDSSLENTYFWFWGNPLLPSWEFILSCRSRKKPLGTGLIPVQLWNRWVISTASSSPYAGGKQQWDRNTVRKGGGWNNGLSAVEEGSKIRSGRKDKHYPKKCFSRLSNTKILRFTETEPRTLGNPSLAHHHTE